ncbi:MAG: hypothetical protein ACI4LK_02300 [Lentihominibacter sp.]
MTQWEVFIAITLIVGFLATVITPIVKLNGTITELTSQVKLLTKTLDEYKESNAKSHDRIWKELNAHDDTLNNHETRLIMIEQKGGQNV